VRPFIRARGSIATTIDAIVRAFTSKFIMFGYDGTELFRAIRRLKAIESWHAAADNAWEIFETAAETYYQARYAETYWGPEGLGNPETDLDMAGSFAAKAAWQAANLFRDVLSSSGVDANWESLCAPLVDDWVSLRKSHGHGRSSESLDTIYGTLVDPTERGSLGTLYTVEVRQIIDKLCNTLGP
jgi:hypothetical protein